MAERTYTPEQIAGQLEAQLPAWKYDDGQIQRTYKTSGWPWTLMLVSAVGFMAEAAFHHPDLNVSWDEVVVKLNTHSAGGITDKDFELAKKIEQSVTWLPGEDDALEGFEKGFKKKWVR